MAVSGPTDLLYKPPLRPEVMLGLPLNQFYDSFEAWSTLSQRKQGYKPRPPRKFTSTTRVSTGIFLHGGNTEGNWALLAKGLVG